MTKLQLAAAWGAIDLAVKEIIYNEMAPDCLETLAEQYGARITTPDEIKTVLAASALDLREMVKLSE